MEIIEFAKAYNNLGWAVQEQLSAVLDGRAEEVNPAALDLMQEMATKFSGSGNDEIAEFVDTVLDAYDEMRAASSR